MGGWDRECLFDRERLRSACRSLCLSLFKWFWPLQTGKTTFCRSSKQAGSQQQRQQQRWRWQTTTTGNLIFRSPPDARINKRRAVQAGSSPYSSDSSDLFLPGTASRRKGSSTVDKWGRDSQDPGLITREMEQTAIEM